MANQNVENDQPQIMNYAERERLKSSDFKGQEELVIIMIAHWMRQREPIPFHIYAANWAAACKRDDASKILDAFPLQGERMMGDDRSDWNTGKNKRRR